MKGGINEIKQLAESDFYSFAVLMNPTYAYGDIHRVEDTSGSGQAAGVNSVLVPSLHRALQHVTNMSNSSE